jgi:antitoxin Phd
MKTYDATTVKNRLGEVIDVARSEPVLVTRSGRDAVVILSAEEYSRFLELEDTVWSRKAAAAEQTGYIGPEAAKDFIAGLLEK